mmetsp:Transcript_107/g.179  ORF Transcript_107/g.179 Transcript_107/m.179 type:complete len:540 (-) Transcript_107:569-2188(-)
MSTEENVSGLKQEHANPEDFEQESGKRKRDEDNDAPTENLIEETDAVKKLKSEQDTTENTSVNVPSVVPTTTPLSNVSFPLAGAPTPIAVSATGAQETILIEISQEKVGQVIGSKGAIIQEIQMRTGAKAYVNQDFPDGVNRQVNLTGTALQVKAAAELVRLIIDQGPTAIHVNSLTGGPTLTSVIECTQAQVGKVIGTSGAVIKDLQSKSGARIQIDQDFPPEVPRKINITGTATAVSLAVSLVQSILNGTAASAMGIGGPYGGGGAGVYGGGMMGSAPHMQYGGASGEMKQTIDVPKSVVGKIIGKGGETITTIQRKSGSKVTVDQSVPEGMPCKVMMSGSAQGLAIASQLINEIMMGVPSGKIGASLPMAPVGHQMGGMGMVNSPYGGYAQPAPAYGMNTYGMPQQMQQPMPQQQQMSQYGGYYPQQQPQMQQQQMQMHQQQHQQVAQQQQQQYAMAAVSGASGYQSYGAAAATPAMGGAGGGGYGAYTAPAAAAVAQKPITASASVWTEHKTDDGITYWYNCSTGVSQWERPKSM